MPTQNRVASREVALQAAKLVFQKKARDIVVLEVGKLTYVTDYFLICTGTSDIQVQSLADHLKENFKKRGHTLYRMEGYREARWVLMDYGDLVVHIFQPEERAFYNLERLWDRAPQLDQAAVSVDKGGVN